MEFCSPWWTIPRHRPPRSTRCWPPWTCTARELDGPPALDPHLARPATLNAPLVRVPRYRAKRGHPIWFSRELIAEFLALPADGPAREVVRRHVDRTEYLDLDDPGIVADIDSPEDYRALMEAGA